MPEVMTIGSALVDVFVHSDQLKVEERADVQVVPLEVGRKIELSSLVVHSGGGATNTAVGFQRLGLRSGVVAELGKDSFAEIVTSELAREGVSSQWLIKERKEQTGGAVILVNADGQRTVLVHRGAAAMLDVGDIPWREVAQVRWVHLSSIGGKKEVLQQLFRETRAQSVGVSWNPGGPELELLATRIAGVGEAARSLTELDLNCQILIVNKEEWAQLGPVQGALQAAIREIVVTDGAEGGQVLLKGQAPLPFAASKVQSVDDTGAGDSFACAYAAARLQERPVTEAIRWGVANAASVVQQVGAKPGLLMSSEIAN